MFLFLSKLLPLLFYPLGLGILLTIAGLVLLKRRRRKSASGIIIVAVWLLYCFSTELVSHAIAQSLEFQHLPTSIPQADAIVVLGGATKPPDAPRPMVEVSEAGDRVLYAAKLYKEGKAPKVILSGGRITWDGDTGSEASDMATLLELLGVPRTALLEDGKSLNTRQNAEYVKEIVDREQFKRLILVTSAVHMPRSLAIFQRLGMDVAPAPTDFYTILAERRRSPEGRLLSLLPEAKNLEITTRSLKEYVGLWIYRLRGWA
jgi:uncharacterized SAM-binding protein YcdF (DUF218 family)